MDLGIAGRTAAIAAASKGLGWGCAKALWEAGCRVAICGRDSSRIAESAESIGEGVVPIVQDVTGLEGGREFVASARRELGSVDILVTNAGGPPPGQLSTLPDSAYHEALELNLLSVVGMCSEALPEMRRQQFGRIVAITSLSARQPLDNLLLSNTARAGVTSFLKSIAGEVAADGVTVNSVQPGTHDTSRLKDFTEAERRSAEAQIPAGFLGEAEDFGKVVGFLCSSHAKFITGAALHIDGGAYMGLQ